MNAPSEGVDMLLVEDSPEDVELTLRALQMQNLANKLHVVKDGAEALEYILRKGAYSDLKVKDAPKVIFLDLKLPKVNGMEVLKQLKADPVARLIPIVVISSSAEEPDIKDCYELGVNSYIVKPVDFDKFAKSIMEVGLYWLVINKPAPVKIGR